VRPTPRIVVYAAVPVVAVAFALLAGSGPPRPRFGAPLRGLSADERHRFFDGQEAFAEVETAEDGLGPVFTENACGACHNEPALGGGNARVEIRVGRWDGGAFDPLVHVGGPIIQDQGVGEGIGVNGPYTYSGEILPPEATTIAGRRSTPLFGLGLVEAVPDETFIAMARFQQAFLPVTAGRPHIVRNLVTGEDAVGRFGWKSQLSTLFDFAGDAYTNEMGITTPLVPDENPPQGDPASLAANPLPNGVPNEPDNEDLVLFSDFMRFLAPPPRGDEDAQTRAGSVIFSAIGCANCHVPLLRTGRSNVAALDRVTFRPFSDFLLHDMGSLGDGIVQGDAGPREMRTAPLWGVSRQSTFLHDGRATTLEEAIFAHVGQGQESRNRFIRLTPARRRQLLAFLRSL
jgi:CxxC motif-containing protein (DUF1111 family)